MTRLKAFLCHFLLSATVVGLALAVVLLVWYPHPYFEVIGAFSVLKILVMVDLILGPMLTLIVFKPGKPGLKFDMSVIALVQFGALAYGLTALYSERPYYNVFAVDRFELVSRTEVATEELEESALPDKPWLSPMYVSAELPSDPDELNRFIEQTLLEGKPDLAKRPAYWRPYQAGFETLAQRVRPLEELARRYPSKAEEIREISAHNAAVPLGYLPIMGKQNVMSLVLDTRDWTPVDVVDADPWESESSGSASADVTPPADPQSS